MLGVWTHLLDGLGETVASRVRLFLGVHVLSIGSKRMKQDGDRGLCFGIGGGSDQYDMLLNPRT